MVDGQLTGHDFANLMRRPGLRGAVKALADNEANYISWQKKLARLDEISDCIRTKASDAQKDELKEERFGIARDFLKTIGVVFEDGEESGQDRINSRDPIAPDWDYDEMIATLSRRAESLKRLPETPVVFGIVERDWAGPDVSRELCETCVHCERDYFCALGIPIQPIWDDLEAATSDCETYRKLPARLLA